MLVGANMVSSLKLSKGTLSRLRFFSEGIYGSIYNKTEEFRTWLLEEKKINPEALSKDQERKEFQVFVEDYNTGTFLLFLEGVNLIRHSNAPARKILSHGGIRPPYVRSPRRGICSPSG